MYVGTAVTPWHGTALLAPCEGNHRSPVNSPHNGPVIVVKTSNLLITKSSCQWFETLWSSCEVSWQSDLVQSSNFMSTVLSIRWHYSLRNSPILSNILNFNSSSVKRPLKVVCGLAKFRSTFTAAYYTNEIKYDLAKWLLIFNAGLAIYKRLLTSNRPWQEAVRGRVVLGATFILTNAIKMNASIPCILVKVPWICPRVPLKVNGAPENI